MASTERSLGWATGVASTDGSSTYDSSRMSAFERSGLGVGILLTGSYLVMSGATTTTLTIADGTAIVGGYFYESNGSVTISTSTLGSGTFSVIIIANTAAGSQVVSANGAGTTIVLTATTRAAIVTAAQLSTITASITATNIVTLGTVTTVAGTIYSITPAFSFTTSRTVPAQVYATLASPSVINATSGVNTTISGYATSYSTSDGIITTSTSSGNFTVNVAGVYQFTAVVSWDANTTGSRLLAVAGSGIVRTLDSYYDWRSAALNAISPTQRLDTSIELSAGAVFYAYAAQNSGSTRTIGDALARLVRL